MSIEWNRVTWYSKLAAVAIYAGTFALAFYLGRMYEAAQPSYYYSPDSIVIPEGPAAE
jgi:hypothetical protein